MNSTGVPYLVVRSLDVVLNNSGERLQAARFCQRLLSIPNGAERFPSPVTRALVAIGFDGLLEPDKLHRGSLSILCQLAILNPKHFIDNGGVRVLLHNVLGCTTPMVLEAILGSLLHLLNVPETRNGACLNLHALVAPLTDPHFKLGIRDQPDKDIDEQEIGHRCAKVAIGTVLRSWSGIAHFCQSENSGLQALIDALYIEQLQIRLSAILEKRWNHDLRRLLTGSERLEDNLATLVEDDPSYLLGAVRCHPLASAVRETISQTMIQNLRSVKNLAFAVLVGNTQLISCVRMKKCFMHPMDLHIVLNLIDSSESFKTGESWTPLCLPRFDSDGFVHGHVSYLADDCQACLVLLTVDRESFFALSEAKQKIVERLRRHNILEAINSSMNHPWPTLPAVNIPEIRHFIYKSRSIAQFVSPALNIPYINLTTPITLPQPDTNHASSSNNDRKTTNAAHRSIGPELRRLYSSYFKLHARIHSQSRPLKLVYWVDDTENWIGWLTTSFEMYGAFEPLVKKAGAINAVNKLLKWIKKEEDRIFIMSSPTF